MVSLSLQGQDIVISNWFLGETEIIQTTRHFRRADLGTYSYTDSEKKYILEQQYLSPTYNPSSIDNFALEAPLRFNAYNGQMEFAKDGYIYYLKKEPGRTVEFLHNDDKYKVVDLFGALEFVLVEVEGKNSLWVRQSMDFILPKQRATTYGYHIRARFRRNSDQYYLALENDQLIELPTNKREFLGVFGNKSKKVERYMNKEGLNHRNEEDLEKIIEYLNTLS
jgi:hypothetical protein